MLLMKETLYGPGIWGIKAFLPYRERTPNFQFSIFNFPRNSFLEIAFLPILHLTATLAQLVEQRTRNA